MKISNLLLLITTTFIIILSCSNDSLIPDIVQQEEKEEDLPKDSVPDGDTDSETATAFTEKHGQLKVQGNKIVDKDGTAIQLRGMSLFWSQWMGKYYTKETVKWLKDDWKCTVVRAAMGVEDADGYISKSEIEKQKVFTVIDAAIEEGIYVIVDWHSHHAENYKTEAKSFFNEVSKKYGNTPNVIYETYNEPLNVSWANTLKPYHEDVIATIRENSNNLIICGTRSWSQRVDEVIGNTIDDENIAYTLHYYSATHKQELRDIAQKAIDNNIAIFVTEYGITEANGNGSFNDEESKLWWDFLDKNSISHCNWSIADKEELSAALKPGASPLGEWPESDITESGKKVRAELIAKNSN